MKSDKIHELLLCELVSRIFNDSRTILEIEMGAICPVSDLRNHPTLKNAEKISNPG